MEHITKDSINFLHFAFNKTKSPSFSQINKQRHIIKFKTPLINLKDKTNTSYRYLPHTNFDIYQILSIFANRIDFENYNL